MSNGLCQLRNRQWVGVFLCCFASLQWITIVSSCFISVFWEVCLIHCFQLRSFPNWLLTLWFSPGIILWCLPPWAALSSPFTQSGCIISLEVAATVKCKASIYNHPLFKSLCVHNLGYIAAFLGSLFQLRASVPWKGCVITHIHEEGDCSHVPASVKFLASCSQKRFTVIMPSGIPRLVTRGQHHHLLIAH